MPHEALREQIEAWERERDGIVGKDFTVERSARVEELDRLIDRAWKQIDSSDAECIGVR